MSSRRARKDRFHLPVILRKTSRLLLMNLNVRRGAACALSAPHPTPCRSRLSCKIFPLQAGIYQRIRYLFTTVGRARLVVGTECSQKSVATKTVDEKTEVSNGTQALRAVGRSKRLDAQKDGQIEVKLF